MSEIYIWWYYNYGYSETGGIFDDIDDALKIASRDRMSTYIINKHLAESGYHDDSPSGCKLVKLKFNGDIILLPERDTVFVLRDPNEIFDDEKKAYRAGIIYSSEQFFNPWKLKRNQDLYDKVQIILSDEDFFNQISLSEIEDIWDEIKFNGCFENHIEMISKEKIKISNR